MSGISGGGIVGLPLVVNSDGDLVYTNPDGDEQIIAAGTELPRTKSYGFQSFSGSSGTNFIAGFYDLQSADLNLSQASATGTHGGANVPYAAHALLVAKEAGAASGGTGGTADITVSGTSITDAGVRTPGDSQVIVADVTAMAADVYYETTKKWIGQITYTIAATDDHTTFSADFNVGFCKYDDLTNHDFTITDFEVVGVAGANDGSFNVALCVHSAANWSYHATAFVGPVGNEIADASTTHSTENDLDSGESFAFKRSTLSTVITGSASAPTTTVSNGYVIKVVTGANGSIQHLDAHVGVKLS